MADLKISQLTGATTPLAGTEVLPIVQSGSTVKVSIANLTAGRAVASAGGTFSDNFVQGTAAKGVNFTANTALAGKTSQLLNYYEEGTWTVTLTPGTSGTIGLYSTFDECQYTRIGRMMFVSGQIKIISTSAPVGTYVRMSLPSYVADLPEIAGRMGSTVSKSNVVYAALAVEGANYIDIQTAASGFTVDEIIAFSFAYVTA